MNILVVIMILLAIAGEILVIVHARQNDWSLWETCQRSAGMVAMMFMAVLLQAPAWSALGVTALLLFVVAIIVQARVMGRTRSRLREAEVEEMESTDESGDRGVLRRMIQEDREIELSQRRRRTLVMGAIAAAMIAVLGLLAGDVPAGAVIGTIVFVLIMALGKLSEGGR